MGKNNKKGPKGNVFKVAGAKSLKKTKAKAVNLGLKNGDIRTKSKSGSKYVRRPGSRRYIEYTRAELEECLAAVRAKEITLKDASEYYNIPQSTIKVKMHQDSWNKPGRPFIFTDEEEELFVEQITQISEFGFPLNNYDMRMIIADYLASQEKTVPQFRDNAPGKDWIKYFRDRHECLAPGLANYMKRVRGLVNETVIEEFLEKLSKETENVHPENVYNYDEINLCVDLEANTFVSRRECKYPEITTDANHSFSVILCGNATGQAIPPYIIYKSTHLCSNWTENGPEGAGYNCTQNGWIDIVVFKDWFLSHILPIFKMKRGKKVLIGDHLSSHLSGEVLSECEKYDISFLCLPSNATKILHPLDVAYFQPLQLIWRQLLLDQKIDEVAKIKNYSYLLKKALNALETKQNLITGFRKTGIFPIDIQGPLAKLKQVQITNNKLMLRRKLNSRLMRSLCHFDDEAGPSSTQRINVQTNKKLMKPKLEQEEFSLASNDISSSDYYLIVVDDNDVFLSPIEESNPPKNPENITTGDHVIVMRDSCSYPGKVLATCEEGAFVKCMRRRKAYWRWPVVMNIQVYSWENIVCRIDVPEIIRRGYYSVPELD